MYAIKNDMKIFATNVAAVDAATATAVPQQTPREFRPRIAGAAGTAAPRTPTHKQSGPNHKYNNKYNKSKFNSNNNNNNNNKRQQQQAQQQQQQQQQHTQLSFNAKKHFGNTNNNNCPSVQQTLYYQQQQQQQHQQTQSAACNKLKLNSSCNNNNATNNNNNNKTNNNNSNLVKNQNILPTLEAITNDSNNNNNNTSNNKLNTKTKKFYNNSNNSSCCSLKRNSLSSSTDSSYYRSCSESSTPPSYGDEEDITRPTEHCQQKQQETSRPQIEVIPIILQTQTAQENCENSNGFNCKPSSGQQDSSFWKAQTKQRAEKSIDLNSKLNSKDDKPANSNVPLIVEATESATTHVLPTRSGRNNNNNNNVTNSTMYQMQQKYNYEQRRQAAPERRPYQQQQQQHQQHGQQQHYYPYHYQQPKQLTIASFLQKDMLPDSESAGQHDDNNNNNNSSGSSSSMGHGNNSRSSNNGAQNSGGYNQRYRNGHYGAIVSHNSSGNNYQGHQQLQGHHHQQQQQNHHNANTQYRRNKHHHNNNENGQGMGKKHNYNNYNNSSVSSTITNGSTKSTTSSANAGQESQQHIIEILEASSYNSSYRRMQHNNGLTNGNINGNVANNKNAYHPSHHLMPGSGTPTTTQHQNFYNLTYVNVGNSHTINVANNTAAAAATTDTTSVSSPTALVNNHNNKSAAILLAPNITITGTGTPTNARCSSTQQPQLLQARLQHNMFVPPPAVFKNTAALLAHGLISSPLLPLSPANVVGATTAPIAITTPSNMISCAQLDEAITAAAAGNTNSDLPPSSSNSSSSSSTAALLPIHNPMFANLPLLLQQHQNQFPQHLFTKPPPTAAAFAENYAGSSGWSQNNSPYQTPYGTSPVNSEIYGSTRSLSPVSSTSSLGSEGHWNNNNRMIAAQSQQQAPQQSHAEQQLTPAGSLSSNAAQLSAHMQGLNGLHGAVVSQTPYPNLTGLYPLLPHICGPNCCWHSYWYEMILPPDRYLSQARNVELVLQPEKLLRNCKYDSLSLAIWNRFQAAQQTQAKFKLKMRLWRYLFLWVNPLCSRYRICLVGSTITGFGMDSSDIDMCLMPDQQHIQNHSQLTAQQQHVLRHQERYEALDILSSFRSIMKDSFIVQNDTQTGVAADLFKNFNLIEARVPILRFMDGSNSIEVDLNYNNFVGIKNTYLLQLYAQLDWRARPLVVIIKLWAQFHDINDAKRMTIPSYSLVLMVLHYLQYGCSPAVLPCLQTLYPNKFQLTRQDCVELDLIESIEPYKTLNTQTLGDHLLGFLKYYAAFDFRTYAISIRTGGVLPVSACRIAKSYKNDPHQWKELNIEEPFDLSNTARSVYDAATFERVKAVISTSAQRLEQSLDINSIFTHIPYRHTAYTSQRMHVQPPQHYANLRTASNTSVEVTASSGGSTTSSLRSA